ncbi:MAG: CvpA family protein [Spirochaetaceae bacterium]|nr:CvpA family protein [Spirochaetaceae bacterium]
MDWSNWNSLDIVLALVVLFMLLRGLLRGALAELFSVGAIVGGIAAAIIFCGPVGVVVEERLGLNGWGNIIAFLGLFIVTYLVMKVAQKILRGFVENINLQNLDKALGLFLGLIEGLALAALIVFVLRLQPLVDLRDVLAGSLSVRVLDPLVFFVISHV